MATKKATGAEEQLNILDAVPAAKKPAGKKAADGGAASAHG